MQRMMMEPQNEDPITKVTETVSGMLTSIGGIFKKKEKQPVISQSLYSISDTYITFDVLREHISDNGGSVKYDTRVENFARLSAHVYGGYGREILPYDCIELDSRKDYTGLKAKVYKLYDDTIVCAFAGTQTLNDWANNISQVVGSSPQYDKALEYGRAVCNKYPGEVIFVGHSQGGGEAAFCAFHLGKEAATFNPAGLSGFTISKAVTSKSQYADVHAYVFWNDILNNIQDVTDAINKVSFLPVSLRADGEIHYITDYFPSNLSIGYWHGMKGILKYFDVI